MAHGIESLVSLSPFCSMDSAQGGHSGNCKFWLLDLGRCWVRNWNICISLFKSLWLASLNFCVNYCVLNRVGYGTLVNGWSIILAQDLNRNDCKDARKGEKKEVKT